MSPVKPNLDSFASSILRSVIPFIRSSDRFNVVDSKPAKRIEEYTAHIQAFVRECEAYESGAAEVTNGKWANHACFMREIASSIIRLWSELVSREFSDGSDREGKSIPISSPIEKAIELESATDQLEAGLCLALSRYPTY